MKGFDMKEVQNSIASQTTGHCMETIVTYQAKHASLIGGFVSLLFRRSPVAVMAMDQGDRYPHTRATQSGSVMLVHNTLSVGGKLLLLPRRRLSELLPF